MALHERAKNNFSIYYLKLFTRCGWNNVLSENARKTAMNDRQPQWFARDYVNMHKMEEIDSSLGIEIEKLAKGDVWDHIKNDRIWANNWGKWCEVNE